MSKTRRQRGIYQRQTTIFGVIGAILTLAALISILWLTDVLPSPFPDDFSAAPPEQKSFVPCVDESLTSLPFSALNVRVYNSTSRTGLATTLSKSLTDQGITVEKVGNWSVAAEESVRIVTGPTGLQAAYSLARLFPESTVILEGDRTTETIDLIIGKLYENPPEAATLAEAAAGGQPLESLEGCRSLANNGATSEPADGENPEDNPQDSPAGDAEKGSQPASQPEGEQDGAQGDSSEDAT